ncbi:MAG: protein kinase, partial [Isosphaeraceae bacterium]
MAKGLRSAQIVCAPEVADRAIQRFLEDCQSGQSNLDACWSDAWRSGADLSVLTALVKADLKRRFALGESPRAAEYLERFLDLRKESDRVHSLVYEEYCLREERGDIINEDSFLDGYADWRDSLASQIRIHRDLSQVVVAPPAPPVFPRKGESFGRFRIVSELGRGGAARVYLAEEPQLADRQVVLKVSLDRGTEHQVLAKLRHHRIVPVYSVSFQEGTPLRGLCMEYRPGLALDEVIRRLNLLKGPRNARSIWETLESHPTPPPLRIKKAVACASEEGPALEEGPPLVVSPTAAGWAGFPPEGSYARGVAWIGACLAEALHHAHGLGIFHRDVKPANVLLTYAEGPQLLDFNLSHDGDHVSQAEAALRGGTFPY